MTLRSLIADPPPLAVFEFDETGAVAVRRDAKTFAVQERSERPLAPGVLEVSAAKPNVQDGEALEQVVEELLTELGALPRPEAAIILPDGASRFSLLDFETLPSKSDERMELIKFRLAKSVPFDMDDARVTYDLERLPHGGRRAMVQATPVETIQQYERALERFGLWPGFVCGSMPLALRLVREPGMTLLAKLSDRTLLLAAIQDGKIRMLRHVEARVSEADDEYRILQDLLADLYPTLVFVADNLGAAVEKVLLAGFGPLLDPALRELPRDLGVPLEPLRSPHGPIGPREAGIWGYVSQA